MAAPGYRNIDIRCPFDNCGSSWVAIHVDWKSEVSVCRIYRCRMCRNEFIINADVDNINDPEGRI